jgi:hypothetical protein
MVGRRQEGTMSMRNLMVGIAAPGIAGVASPSYADGLPIYRDQGTTYQRETHTYERYYVRWHLA